MIRTSLFKRLLLIAVLAVALLGPIGWLPARSAVPHLGYGFNASNPGNPNLPATQFNWIKIFDVVPSNLPATVLLRVEANHGISVSELLTDIQNKLDYLGSNELVVAAWEIGNEPNIDAAYGWGTTPNVAAYKDRLCAAYGALKAYDPNFIVVSAGLAPVGRLTNEHQIDDREFVAQLLDMGGGACLDAVGYHPYGYSADYDAAPDVASADPTQNCVQGFCFRGAEKIYEIMQAHGAGDKKVWATEFGWITRPPDHCLNDPSWAGRAWQIVTEEKQASNLVGAYQYADAHWPWMGAMFVFNFDFNTAPWYPECEQMRYYGVQGRPAESALTAMPKNPATIAGRLRTTITAVKWAVAQDLQPINLTAAVDVANYGWGTLTYTATVDAAAGLVPSLPNPIGTLGGTAQSSITLNVPNFTRAPGTYTGTLTINWYAAGAANNPRFVPLEVTVLDLPHRAYVPMITR